MSCSLAVLEPRSRRDRGVALILVLVVLAALLSMAIPFSWSMKNASESAGHALQHTQDEIDLRGAFDLACNQLEATHVARDKTPHSDAEGEWQVDLPALMKRYEIDQSNPKLPSQKIWSAQVTDLEGRIDLNAATLYTVANALDAGTFLEKEIDVRPDLDEVQVTEPTMLPEKGIVWITGELFLYEGKRGPTLTGVKRAYVTPARPAPNDRRLAHALGDPVIDYRAYLLATYLYRARPGKETSLNQLQDAKQISKFGEVALTARDLDRLREVASVFGSRPGPRFSNPQVITDDLKAGSSFTAKVLNGQHVAPGTIVRIRNSQGVAENNLVVSSSRGDDGWTVTLDLPVANGFRRDDAILETLTPEPVNVNSAPRAALASLVRGLVLRASPDQRIPDTTALAVADALVHKRPLGGLRDLDAVLTELTGGGILSKEQRAAVAKNAYAPDADLGVCTQPFTFASGDLFEVTAAVSDNYLPQLSPLGRLEHAGLEKSRRFGREIVSAPPSGTLSFSFLTQRDFLESTRLSRLGRYWTSRPINLDLWDGYNYPPREDFAARPGAATRYADEGTDNVGASLATARLNLSNTVHFDEGDLLSLDPEGWDVQREFKNGGRIPKFDLRAEPLSAVSNISGQERLQPFSVSLYWKPKDLDQEQVLWDTGMGDVEDRIVLMYEKGELIFRVFDHSLPYEFETNRFTIGEWRYAFDDGLELKKDQWYYVSAFAKGNAPGEMVMFVDGIPRGHASFATRLKSNVQAKVDDGLSSLLGDPSFEVKATDTFNPGPDVVCIGTELIEYQRALGRKRDKGNEAGMEPSFDLTAEGVHEVIAEAAELQGGGSVLSGVMNGSGGVDKKKKIGAFGGRGARGTRAVAHKAESFVTTYGYSARLVSEKVPNGDQRLSSELGPFYVARIDYSSTKDFKSITITPKGGQRPFPLGNGLPNTDKLDRIPLAPLDGNPDPKLQKAFQRDGGYALLVTLDVTGKINVNGVETDLQNQGRVGGAEVVRYESYDGRALQTISRGKNMRGYKEMGGGSKRAGDLYIPASHIVTTDANWGYATGDGKTQLVPKTPGTFVVPISLKIANVDLTKQFGDPARSGRCELVQIDTDFKSTDSNATEWVRYNAIVTDTLVRSEPTVLGRVAMLLNGFGIDPNNNGKRPQFTDTLIYRWRIADDAKHTQKDAQLLADNINYEDIFDNPGGHNMLAFRGCLGTHNVSHSAGARVLPVIWFFSIRTRPEWAHPGRHDHVTLISSEEAGDIKARKEKEKEQDYINADDSGEKTQPREHAEINYAWCGPLEDIDANSGRGGGNGFATSLVAFHDAVKGSFYRSNMGQRFNTNSAEEEIANAVTRSEARGFTRMVKFPSGELPTEIAPDQQLYLGSDYRGKEPAGDMVLDEVRFVGSEYFNPLASEDDLFRTRRYVLDRQLKYQDDGSGEVDGDRVYLARYRMRFPQTVMDRDHGGGPAVEAYHAVDHLPDDGGLLWIDDELLAFCEKKYDAEGATGELVLAPSGRALFGTERGHHEAGASAMYLPFCMVSRLARGITKTAGAIPLADADGDGIGEKPTGPKRDDVFPREGTVLIDQELIHYDRRDGDTLIMAQQSDDLGLEAKGLFRGRFGTPAQPHDERALVYWFPFRYWDRYVPGADHPQFAALDLHVPARRALFRKVSWGEDVPKGQVDLICRALVGGRGRFDDIPGTNLDLFEFTNPETPSDANVIARQGDYVDLRFYVRYGELAFDPVDFRKNDWKTAPLLKWVLVDYLQPRTVELHEEWR